MKGLRYHFYSYRSPEDVFYVFVDERELMLRSIGNSLVLLGLAVGIALVLGIFLGLIVGWTPRLREALVPIANVIGPIPPLVYTPYVVAVMPSFRSSSVFVIFSAVFWPIFLTMIGRVKAMDPHITEAAQTMDVTAGIMLMGIVVTIIDILLDLLSRKCIKWDYV